MESKTGERVIFPGAHLDWISPHVVGMETLLHQVQVVGVFSIDQLCWNLKSIDVYGTTTIIRVFDWFFPISGHRIDHQGELLFVFSLMLMFMYKHNDRDLGTNLQPSAYVTIMCDARRLWMSQDRGDWSLILQCYDCMLIHIWILSCWCSVRCLWHGLNIQERWVGLPTGIVHGFPVGSWSLSSIWEHMNTYARCQSIDTMVYLKMLRALALMWYENKLYWKSLGAEIVQQIE